MVRAVWLDPGSGRPGALLLTVHHLAVDGFSWRVLGQELAAALDGRSTDDAAPAGTASFTRWSRLLSREAALRLDELPWWERQLADATARLTDVPAAGGRMETSPSIWTPASPAVCSSLCRAPSTAAPTR